MNLRYLLIIYKTDVCWQVLDFMYLLTKWPVIKPFNSMAKGPKPEHQRRQL
jgi:hypothetical protein